jgi:hypothetical protein
MFFYIWFNENENRQNKKACFQRHRCPVRMLKKHRHQKRAIDTCFSDWQAAILMEENQMLTGTQNMAFIKPKNDKNVNNDVGPGSRAISQAIVTERL